MFEIIASQAKKGLISIDTAVPNYIRCIIAPLIACGVGFLYLITPESAVYLIEWKTAMSI